MFLRRRTTTRPANINGTHAAKKAKKTHAAKRARKHDSFRFLTQKNKNKNERNDGRTPDALKQRRTRHGERPSEEEGEAIRPPRQERDAFLGPHEPGGEARRWGRPAPPGAWARSPACGRPASPGMRRDVTKRRGRSCFSTRALVVWCAAPVYRRHNTSLRASRETFCTNGKRVGSACVWLEGRRGPTTNLLCARCRRTRRALQHILLGR